MERIRIAQKSSQVITFLLLANASGFHRIPVPKPGANFLIVVAVPMFVAFRPALRRLTSTAPETPWYGGNFGLISFDNL